MTPNHEPDLPSLQDLDALDQERALDMVDNRPLYERRVLPDLPLSSTERNDP
jgi:hypothetical protein